MTSYGEARRTGFGIIQDQFTAGISRDNRYILSIDTLNNNDGSSSITINFSDGSSELIATNLVSDNLVALDAIILQDGDKPDKFLVKNNANQEIFKVNTAQGETTINGLVDITGQLEVDGIARLLGPNYLNGSLFLPGLPNGSTLSTGLRSVLVNIATGQVCYEASFEIAADGTKTFFNNVGDSLLTVVADTNRVVIGPAGEFFVDTGNSIASFSTNTFEVASTTISQTAIQSYQVAAPVVRTVTNTLVQSTGSIFNVFKKK